MSERGVGPTITSYDVRRVVEVHNDAGDVTEIKVDYFDDGELTSARVVLNGFVAVMDQKRSRHVGHYDGHHDQFAILVIDHAIEERNTSRHREDPRPLRPIGTLVIAESITDL